jgi:hypothetical protein
MLRIDNQGTIFLTRGDSAFFDVEIQHGDKAFQPMDGDVLNFSVKRTPNDEEYCIKKSFSPAEPIVIEPADTKDMAFGRYMYDVQLTRANGEVYTIVEPKHFYVKEEITNG